MAVKYPNKPTSIQDIDKVYIQTFFRDGIYDGKITQEQLAEWITTMEQATANNTDETTKKVNKIKAFNAYRKAFALKYFPYLDKTGTEPDIDFFRSLKK